MCYVVCREININAVVVSPTSQHLLEIDERCTYPKCTVCLLYCPAEGSIVEAGTGRSLVPPRMPSRRKIKSRSRKFLIFSSAPGRRNQAAP